MTVFRFSRLVGTGACALLLFVATLYLQRLPHTSGDVELLYPKESATLSALEEQQRVFEDVMYDALVLKVQSLKNMSLELEDLEQELAEIDGIVEVLAPHGVSELDPFGLVNEDTNHVRLLLKIDNRLDAAEKRHVNKNIRAVLESHSEMKPLRSGSFVTTEEVGASVSRETQRVIPLIILALAITLMSLLRSPMLCFFIVTNVGIAIGSSLLGYSLLGFPLGPLSQLAPPFLLAVGAAFHLHVAVRLRNTALEHRAAVLHELRLGVALAATTTIISLLTLCSFDIRDVTRFSLLSSAGTLLSALQALFVLPGFVRHRKSQAKHLAT
ncbi:MAG: MMPL family transporter, partial [Bdellovibrionales bacterium]|nr:MMPL family transporter [Bdellovibrionales bacterium]